jgi:signal transduction histidine kinase
VNELLERVKAGLRGSATATRAALLTGLVFALGLGTITLYALRVFEARYLQLVGDRQFELVRAHASRLDDKLRTAQTVLAGVARTVDAAQLARPAALQQTTDARVFLHVSFDRGVRIYDATGALLVQSPAAHPLALPEAQEAWLKGLAGRSDKHLVSAPFSLSPTQAQPGLLMASPILDERGRVIGTMVGALDLLSNHFMAGMRDYRVGQGGYLFMTSGDRVMLMHPRPERVLRIAAAPGQNAGYDKAIGERMEGTVETVNSEGRHVLVSYARMPFVDWILAANFPMSEARQPFLQALNAVRWPLLGVALLLTLAVGVTVHRLLRPIRQLSQRLLDVGEGRAQSFDLPGGGEVGVLARAYNRMLAMLNASEAARRESEARIVQANESLEQRVLERTEAIERANAELSHMLERNARMQADLVQSEKQAALGRLVAGLGHELSTPMGNALMVATAMQHKAADFGGRAADGSLSLAELERFAVYCRDACELVERNLSRANRLVTSFKQSAVDQIAERRRRFDLRQTIEEVMATLEHLMKFRPLRLHLALAPDIEMDSYPGAIGQVLTNMFINALVHGFGPEQAGDIWVSARHEGPDEVRIELRDNGRGIDPEVMGKVFDPFFTTRLGQGGSGLGLYIVFNAVTGPLRGHIEVHSEPGAGTTFIVTVPRVVGDAPPDTQRDHPGAR